VCVAYGSYKDEQEMGEMTDGAGVVIAAMQERRSIRTYTDRPVPDEIVERIIRAGIEAPTGMGVQPWQFIVVRNKELMRKISDYCKPILVESLQGVKDEKALGYRTLLEDPAFNIFYNAPVLVMVIGDGRDPMSEYDCALCAGNMLLAASAMGLGGCWIGSAEVAQENEEIKNDLKIPKHYRIIAPLIIGYPAEIPEKPDRREPKITWIA
jgi:nitroreductase